LLLAALLVFGASTLLAQDTLPEKISDQEFWKLIETLSEPDGHFQSQNLLSNELDFPRIMVTVERFVKPGGVYLGVGPEQNFNYIAATRPKIAFIIDIRRQNMLEHLMYKALFELSANRSAFLSRLFSRKQPEKLAVNLSAAELFDAYSDVSPDEEVFKKNLRDIETLLVTTHRFALTDEDRANIEWVYGAFRDYGPLIDYNSRGGGPSGGAFRPSYARLMTETDDRGRERSYLANETNYGVLRDLEIRNLIVPLTGDFGGPSAIRAVGGYVRDHGAIVSAFYTSNVEGYLFQGGDRAGNANGGIARFYENVATLPLNESSTFIRWIPTLQGGIGIAYRGIPSIVLEPIQTTIKAFRSGEISSANFFGRRGRLGGVLNNPRRGAPLQRPSSASRIAPLLFDWTVYAWILFHMLAAVVAFVVAFVIKPSPSPALPRDKVLSITTAELPPVEASQEARLLPRARILYAFVWASAGYVVAGLIDLALHAEESGFIIHLDQQQLALVSLLIDGLAAILFALGSLILLAPFSWRDYQRVIMAAPMLPLLTLPLFGIQASSDINRGLDLQAPVTLSVPVLQRWEERGWGTRGRNVTYHIAIDPAFSGSILPEDIRVHRRVYESLIEGDTIPVVVGVGALGIPWYRSINGLSMYE
jgi:hypothetical protein